MWLNIIQIIVGVILLAELLFVIFSAKSAPDYTYYLCRPFGIPFNMFIGALVRLGCAVLGGILLYRGIVGLL